MPVTSPETAARPIIRSSGSTFAFHDRSNKPPGALSVQRSELEGFDFDIAGSKRRRNDFDSDVAIKGFWPTNMRRGIPRPIVAVWRPSSYVVRRCPPELAFTVRPEKSAFRNAGAPLVDRRWERRFTAGTGVHSRKTSVNAMRRNDLPGASPILSVRHSAIARMAGFILCFFAQLKVSPLHRVAPSDLAPQEVVNWNFDRLLAVHSEYWSHDTLRHCRLRRTWPWMR